MTRMPEEYSLTLPVDLWGLGLVGVERFSDSWLLSNLPGSDAGPRLYAFTTTGTVVVHIGVYESAPAELIGTDVVEHSFTAALEVGLSVLHPEPATHPLPLRAGVDYRLRHSVVDHDDPDSAVHLQFWPARRAPAATLRSTSAEGRTARIRAGVLQAYRTVHALHLADEARRLSMYGALLFADFADLADDFTSAEPEYLTMAARHAQRLVDHGSRHYPRDRDLSQRGPDRDHVGRDALIVQARARIVERDAP